MSEAALGHIEQQVVDVFLSVFGDPIFIGIAILIMIVGLIAFARLGMAAAVVILIPSLFVTFVFIEPLRIIAAILIGVIIAFGLLRLLRQ